MAASRGVEAAIDVFYTGNVEELLHQSGERAVVILGQYFRQLLVDWFVLGVLVHDLDVSIFQLTNCHHMTIFFC